ncbi:hypothetical protein BDR07DRAFT_1497598 [Suillus spraguei]|nr:hypothetical protein BDR07DRAFT_1497598 [Suillus spraguei]
MPPRFRYHDLDGLTTEEKHAEQMRRWYVRQMQDPEKAARIRERSRENKRAQRQRARLEKESANLGAPPPRFRRQIPLSTSDVPRSTSIDDDFIDPILKNPAPHRLMSNVAVMTDSSSSAHHTADRQTAPKLDLVSDILGAQVPRQSGTVTWPDAHITVLPCVMIEGVNVCEDNDAAMVHFLSTLTESKPDSTYVEYIKHIHLTRRQLQHSVGNALSRNKPVVIRGFGNQDVPALDVEYLETNFGISPQMRVTVHDVAKRVTDFTHPHKQATIQKFMDAINDPSKIQCILDIPLAHVGLPQDFQLLDHGLVYGWNQTTVDCPIRSGKVHPDNFTVKSWALLHQAGYVSYPHHDADGAVTFLQIQSGVKFWVVFRTKEKLSRTALQKAQMLFANWRNNREEIDSTWHGEVITLLPGDLLFQPAGQVHAVYTPVPSFATGGSFYHYDSLHLTEMSRYIDANKAQFLTNQVHENAVETFQRMLIALPRLTQSIRLCRRPIIALCLMIINRDKYKASNNNQGYQVLTSESTERSIAIATAIIRFFYHDTATAQRSYRTGDQSDPGEPLSIEDLSTCLGSFTSIKA